ncbi:Hypothetical protein AA314_01441 [Archangium gephyra]|uniref:Uncharacterized protein n=1 Tax=Archangium gephyra TaxID=48 RepID=A0AAC8Q2H5_9BACT|nr:Hypothetical protein AA314_01441 [Archangium gephyra]
MLLHLPTLNAWSFSPRRAAARQSPTGPAASRRAQLAPCLGRSG